MAEVTVVIPTHNRRRLLEETVRSVTAQAGVDCDVVVVDDGSEDDTSLWLAEVASPRLRWLRNDLPARESAARNAGAALSDSEFLLFLDDDDQLAPGALAALIAPLRSRKQALAAAGAYRQLTSSGLGRRHQVHPRFAVSTPIWREALLDWNLPPGAVLWRRAAFDRLGRWNEAISDGEDRELNLRTYPLPLLMVPTEVLHYRIHPGQATVKTTVGTELREDFAERLGPPDGDQARRILEARPQFLAGLHMYAEGDYRRSLDGLRSVLKGTGLARSPILGPWLVGLVAKAVAGAALPSPVAAAVRRTRRKTRSPD